MVSWVFSRLIPWYGQQHSKFHLDFNYEIWAPHTNLAPLSTWKKLQNLQNYVVLDVVYIGLLEIANKRAFLVEIRENLWSEKDANPTATI